MVRALRPLLGLWMVWAGAACSASADVAAHTYACTADDQCRSPHKCVGGFCQTPGAVDAGDSDASTPPDTSVAETAETTGAAQDTAPASDLVATDAAGDGDAAVDVATDSADAACPVGDPCNGKDDDCDGKTDEDALWQGLAVGQACTGPGACGPGLVECASASQARCSSGPGGSQSKVSAETCNGQDDDCDGITDDDFALAGIPVGQTCTAAGVCGLGVLECESAKAVRCSAAPGGSQSKAAPESCNNLDDNCDGATDEGFALDTKGGKVPLGGACKGPGACGTGAVECAAGGKATQCSTSPGGSAFGGKSELCNGVDDDCNGLTDETFSYKGLFVGDACLGVGACGAGTVECATAATVTCSTNPTGSEDKSTAETCNNKDDDCDGQTDEVCIDGDGDSYCAGNITVTAACKVCQASGDCDDKDASLKPGATEQCNGKDDNCDGITDAANAQSGPLSQSCYEGAVGTVSIGICKAGSQLCAGGGWAKCNGQVLPGSELCGNKVDDDCDSSTDEGCPVSVPGGSYSLGCTLMGQTCGADTTPPFPYPVEPFSIGAAEVTVADYQLCVAAKLCSVPFAGAGCNWGDPAKSTHPVNCVTWQQATDYCSWALPGGSLPSEFEWQGAAVGASCAPLGVQPQKGDCPPKTSTVYAFGANAATCSLANFNDGAGCGGATKPAATPTLGPLGLANMAGNVAEWTSSWFAAYPFMPGQAPTTGTARVVMGGSYASSASDIYVWSRQALDPTSWAPTIGFRCRSK